MNIINAVQSMAINIPFIMGTYLLFYVLNIADLSIEAAYLAGAAVSAQLLGIMPATTVSAIFVLCAATCAGALVGIGTVLIRRYCVIPHVLASIIMIGIVQTGVYALTGGAHKSLEISAIGLPFFMFYVVSISIAFLLFFKTQLGLAMTIYGINKHFLQYHRLSEFFVYATGIALSNALAGMSGFLVVIAHGFFDLSMAQGVLLQALCAAMLGFIPLARHASIKHLAPITGAAIYVVIQQLLLKFGCTSVYFTFIQSVLLIVCLLVRRFVIQKGKS